VARRNGVRSRFPPCVRAQEPAALLRAWASGVPARSLTLASGMTALFLIPLLRHPGRYTSPIAARDWQASVRVRDPACGPNTNAHLNSFVSPCLRARPDIKPASHQDTETRRALQRGGRFVGQCTRRPETPPSARRWRAVHPPPHCVRRRRSVSPSLREGVRLQRRQALQRGGSLVGLGARRPETPPSARRLRAAHPPPRKRRGNAPPIPSTAYRRHPTASSPSP